MIRFKDKPITYRVLIEQEKLPEKSSGGIVLDSNPHERAMWQAAHTIGTVMDIGGNAFDHKRMEGCPVKVGDLVRFKQHAGHQFRGNMDEYGKPCGSHLFMVNDDDILSIVEKEEVENG